MSVRDVIFWVAMVVAVPLVYAPGFTGPFVYDDVKQIEQNTRLHDISNPVSVVFNGLRQTRLLQNVTFAIDWTITPNRTLSFKITNLILHLLCGMLIFFLLREFFPQNSFLVYATTSLFLLHPLQIQSVSYVMGRNTLLYSLIFILALWKATRMTRFDWLPFLPLMLIGILVKEIIVVLPVVLYVYWAVVKEHDWWVVKNKSFWILLGIGLLYIPFFLVFKEQQNMHAGVVGWDLYPYGHYLLAQCRNYLYYLFLFVWPSKQSLFHPLPPMSTTLIISAMAGALLYVGTLYWCATRHRKYPVAVFFALMFMIVLFPTNGPIQVINPLAEYRLYLSNLCLCLLFVWGVQYTMTRLGLERVLPMLMSAIVIFFSSFTFLHAHVWGNGYEVYRQTADVYPNNSQTVYMAGTSYEKVGDYKSAQVLYRQAVSLIEHSPSRSAKPIYRLAYVEFALGNFEESLTLLDSIPLRALNGRPPEQYYSLRLMVTARLSHVLDFDRTLQEGISHYGEAFFTGAERMREGMIDRDNSDRE